jgi:hypothetical protein
VSVKSVVYRVGCLVLAGALAGAIDAAAQPPAGAGELAVTVTYKGKGEVKAGNELTVFLFGTPTINSESEPIGMQTLEKNGGVLHFQGLPETVYLAAVYDEKGDYDQQGPPLAGTPITIHADPAGTSIGVKTGKEAKVAITFDDTRRMP